jgi:hypothetical protein
VIVHGALATLATGAVLAASALCAAPSAADDDWPFQPVPIGAAPEYHPAPRWPLAGAAAFRGLGTELRTGARVHLELFANRRVVIVPGGIGVSGGRSELYGNVMEALWRAPLWTTTPGGVIRLSRPGLRLGDLFAVWGQPLGPDRLLSFRARDGDGVVAFVNGERRRGPPAGIVLHDADQIVLEVDGYVPPHPSFAFAGR